MVVAMSVFAQRLRQLIEARGITQRELAEMAGVHPSTIYRWLYEDKLPRRAQLRAVAQALSADEDWLMGRTDAPQANVNELIQSIREAQQLIERALKVLDTTGVLQDEQLQASPPPPSREEHKLTCH